jgi:hypothetical protein
MHGLIAPAQIIDPYEMTLNRMSRQDRGEWARRVLDRLLPRARDFEKVVFFAGVRYREHLIGPIRQSGLPVEVPMEGLSQGRQLAWLDSQL